MNFDDPTLRDIFASFGKNRKAERGGYHKKIFMFKNSFVKI